MQNENNLTFFDSECNLIHSYESGFTTLFDRYLYVGAWIIRYWTGPLLYREAYKGGQDSKNAIATILIQTVLRREFKAEGYTFTPNLVRGHTNGGFNTTDQALLCKITNT